MRKNHNDANENIAIAEDDKEKKKEFKSTRDFLSIWMVEVRTAGHGTID